MTNSSFILKDRPHGGGRSYNGLRIALSFSRHASNYVRVFLVRDAIECARDRFSGLLPLGLDLASASLVSGSP